MGYNEYVASRGASSVYVQEISARLLKGPAMAARQGVANRLDEAL
jgi:hypothetical protein